MRDMPVKNESFSPRISIGLVVYNGQRHIQRALDSVVSQSYSSIELIVVDGDSTDGTKDILRKYAEHIAIFISEPDKGIYDAMNKVCEQATGDWLIFIGCDDVLLDMLENSAELMTEADSIYYGDVIQRSDGKLYGGKFSKIRMMKRNICHQALFYPRSVYKKYPYNLKYRWLADYAYNLNLIGESIPLIYTGVVVSIFNNVGGSSLGDEEFDRDKVKLIRASFGIVYASLKVLINLRFKTMKKIKAFLAE